MPGAAPDADGATEIVVVIEAAERLDKALAAAVPEAAGLSRSRLQALIAAGAVADAEGVVLDDPRVKLAPGTGVGCACRRRGRFAPRRRKSPSTSSSRMP